MTRPERWQVTHSQGNGRTLGTHELAENLMGHGDHGTLARSDRFKVSEPQRLADNPLRRRELARTDELEDSSGWAATALIWRWPELSSAVAGRLLWRSRSLAYVTAAQHS